MQIRLKHPSDIKRRHSNALEISRALNTAKDQGSKAYLLIRKLISGQQDSMPIGKKLAREILNTIEVKFGIKLASAKQLSQLTPDEAALLIFTELSKISESHGKRASTYIQKHLRTDSRRTRETAESLAKVA